MTSRSHSNKKFIQFFIKHLQSGGTIFIFWASHAVLMFVSNGLYLNFGN